MNTRQASDAFAGKRRRADGRDRARAEAGRSDGAQNNGRLATPALGHRRHSARAANERRDGEKNCEETTRVPMARCAMRGENVAGKI